MNSNPCDTKKTTRKSMIMNALGTACAAMAIGTALYSPDSSAVLVLANGTHEVEWYVGEAAPSIDLAPDQFVVLACGAELVWVYAAFPTIATRTIQVPAIQGPALQGPAARRKSAVITGTPTENTCVLWRGDNARFIADNLAIVGS